MQTGETTGQPICSRTQRLLFLHWCRANNSAEGSKPAVAQLSQNNYCAIDSQPQEEMFSLFKGDVLWGCDTHYPRSDKMDQLCCWKIFLITLSDPLLPLRQDSNAFLFCFFFSTQHWFSSFALVLCKLTINTPILQCWIIMKLFVFSHPLMPALESASCLAWHCCWAAIQCVHNQGGRLSWWTVVSRGGFENSGVIKHVSVCIATSFMH